MAQLTVNIPAGAVQVIADAFAHEYQMPNADTALLADKVEFARQRVIEYIREIVNAYNTQQAQTTATQGVPAPPTLT